MAMRGRVDVSWAGGRSGSGGNRDAEEAAPLVGGVARGGVGGIAGLQRGAERGGLRGGIAVADEALGFRGDGAVDAPLGRGGAGRLDTLDEDGRRRLAGGDEFRDVVESEAFGGVGGVGGIAEAEARAFDGNKGRLVGEFLGGERERLRLADEHGGLGSAGGERGVEGGDEFFADGGDGGFTGLADGGDLGSGGIDELGAERGG